MLRNGLCVFGADSTSHKNSRSIPLILKRADALLSKEKGWVRPIVEAEKNSSLPLAGLRLLSTRVLQVFHLNTLRCKTQSVFQVYAGLFFNTELNTECLQVCPKWFPIRLVMASRGGMAPEWRPRTNNDCRRLHSQVCQLLPSGKSVVEPTI